MICHSIIFNDIKWRFVLNNMLSNSKEVLTITKKNTLQSNAIQFRCMQTDIDAISSNQPTIA
jgi:hypothetical protein